MPPITIIRTSHQTELDPAGGVRKLVRIDFKVGNDGPFNLSFPEADFNQQVAFDAISKFAAQINGLRGQLAGGQPS